MNGRVLDAALVAVYFLVFLSIILINAGVATLVWAWAGAAALGWYNAAVRHRLDDGLLRERWLKA